MTFGCAETRHPKKGRSAELAPDPHKDPYKKKIKEIHTLVCLKSWGIPAVSCWAGWRLRDDGEGLARLELKAFEEELGFFLITAAGGSDFPRTPLNGVVTWDFPLPVDLVVLEFQSDDFNAVLTGGD
jgi:hypothetical protein